MHSQIFKHNVNLAENSRMFQALLISNEKVYNLKTEISVQKSNILKINGLFYNTLRTFFSYFRNFGKLPKVITYVCG